MLDLFREELVTDVTKLRDFVEKSEHAAIKGFAHKYKVRLHYLGYAESYETCLRIEKHFREAQTDELMSDAQKLLTQITNIQNSGA